MQHQHILAIDQGTSGTKTVIFDTGGRITAKASEPLKSYFPQPGFVEQNPQEIYLNVLNSVKKCLHEFNAKVSGNPANIAACGISNQRETLILWDESGQPLSPAIVWQCKRSIEICDKLKHTDLENEIKKRTGLIIDPYFSGTKLIWLLENNPEIQNAVSEKRAYFGTVDTWLLYKLTDGQSYCTDYTNASRTLFFNIHDLQWDNYLLEKFKLKNLNFPQVRPSSWSYGASDFGGLFPKKIEISTLIGDSHAAAFGECCFAPGDAKATLGTGSSILLNTGNQIVDSHAGMVSTVCWSTRERVDYALEGIIVTCGATIKWLRDQLNLFANSHDIEAMALAVPDNNGVYLIPAFSGLGAPHWKMDLKAAVLGLTFGCNKNHLVRAALESIPYQIKDVISCMEIESRISLKELKVDGGITANRFVMQFLANVLHTNVVNIGLEEVSALGAAYLAGLEIGLFTGLDQIPSLQVNQNIFFPDLDQKKVEAYYQGWKKTIETLTKS